MLDILNTNFFSIRTPKSIQNTDIFNYSCDSRKNLRAQALK